MIRKFLLLAFGLIFLAGCSHDSPAAPAATLKPVTEASLEVPSPVPTQDLAFDQDHLNQIPPDEIIAEIAYFGLPGGGGDNPCLSENKPAAIIAPSEVEIMQEFTVSVCEIPDGDVKVRITQPDGLVTESIEKTWNGAVAVSYQVGLSQPMGHYQFQLTGVGWELSTSVEVCDADSARLFIESAEGKITFYHFQPNEKVRLLLYESSQSVKDHLPGLSLKGWKEYQMDRTGRLIISVRPNSINSNEIVSVGAYSGQVPRDWLYSYQFESFAIACGRGVKPIGIHPGDYVQVIADQAYLVQRNTWENFQPLNKGDILQVRAGPFCHDDAFYWDVTCSSSDYCDGSISELNSGAPLVQVLKELPTTPTPDLSKIPSCPGAKPTRLTPNMQAKVSQVATQISMRAQAGMDAAKVHVIASGRLVNILAELPVCADGAYWWHIFVPEKGFEGWVREGDSQDYWIDPLP